MSSITSVSASTVGNASSATPGTVQGAAALMVLRKTMDMQAAGAMQLIQALPQAPSLAASGQLGTQLNVYA
jgi:hypothetical protein